MTQFGTVIKSPSDNRTYRAIKLQNQLQCLLVHDKDALKSCAALSMGVGSFRDPIEAQGLAHYLEHMLFMGTKKYPDQNDYSSYITKNAGSNNAYTGQQQTNYMLQVSSTAFEGALDRFAQFFVAPLLAQGSAQRQLNAVHSEHQKNILNDDWRKFQLSKFISKDKHPYNKFSTGDKDSLANQNLPNMLGEFYKVNYSSNLMKLVIYSNQQLDTLQKWAVQKFSQVPNHNYKRFALEQQPYDSKAFKKIFKIVPIKDLKKLELMWILPNKKQHYRNPPGNYISNLVGHQGKGSILSYLMKQGLATSLTSGTYDNYNCYTEFTISMDITEKGLTQINEIIGYILYYIQMLKQKGCPQFFFEQLKLINKLKFEFMDKKKGMMETAKIAKDMQDRKIQQLIIYPYLMEQWKPEIINQYLSELTSENLFVFCTAKEFENECKLQQPVYKTKYSCEELKDIKPLPCNVDLPQSNIFIPKDLSVLPSQTEKLPNLIYKSQFIDAFFKRDHIFGLPKANINLRLIFDGNFTVVQQIGRALLLDMLKQHLREFVYLAEMASIQTQISFVSYIGLDIKFKGFKDSLKLFVVEYLKRLFQFVPSDQQLFKTLVQKHSRKYANYFLSDPYSLAYSKSSSTIRTNSSVNEEDKVVEIEKLNLPQVVQLNNEWKKKLFLECYFGGNITDNQSLQIVKSVQKFLSQHSKPHKKQNMGQMRPVHLQKEEISVIQQSLKNKAEQNSAISVHFQVGELTIKTELLLKLLQIISKQPAFDYLRTQQQLGYVVFCLSQDHRGVGGLSIIVQSSIKSSYQLIPYVDAFFSEKLKAIADKLTEEEFTVYKNSLKQIKQEKDKNLAAQTLRYWAEIVKHKYIFDRKQKELQLLPQITLAQMKQFIQQNIYNNPRRIQIHMMSDKKSNENTVSKNNRKASNNAFKVYETPESFNRKAQLYPDFYAPNP